MKQQNVKTYMMALGVVLIGSSLSIAQHDHSSHNTHSNQGQKNEKIEKLPTGLSEMDTPENRKMMTDSSKVDNQMMDIKDKDKTVSDGMKGKKGSIIRDGQIDLKAIDKNKDGKVFQDVMDWNVISDEPGECPKCGMTLKEVSLEKAKENLIKHNFKVKE